MQAEKSGRSHLHLCKASQNSEVYSSPSKFKLPSGEISITTQGDKLILRPSSPYRYTSTPEVLEADFSESEECSEDTQIHQRSSTTVINDIAQSYTFAPMQKRTEESIENSEASISVEFYRSQSFLASTSDPQSFFTKIKTKRKKNSNLLTISSGASELGIPDLSMSMSEEHSELRRSLYGSVMAFCKKCGKNTLTEVKQDVYLGTL